MVTPPPAAGLYGARAGPSQTTSDLYTINPATGTATSVGPIGFAVTGLAFRPSDGILFGATSNQSAASPANLITVDPVTGSGTLVGAFGTAGGSGLSDLAFRSDDVLFGYSPANPRRLYTVDQATGAATQVSATAVAAGNGYGLSFDSADTLYEFNQGSAGTYQIVDSNTGGLTAQPTLTGAPVTGAIPAAAFDSADILYALINATPTRLVIIDVSASTVADVGATTQDMDALAWSV